MWSTSVVGDARLTLSLEIVMRALLVSLVATLAVLSPTALSPTAVAAEPGPRVLPQVVGGQPADPGEDPWMAALVVDQSWVSNPFAGLVCGASFISWTRGIRRLGTTCGWSPTSPTSGFPRWWC